MSLPVSLASTDIWGENLTGNKMFAINDLTHRWLCSTPFSSFGERERGSRLQIIIRVLFWTASGKKTCISSSKYFLLKELCLLSPALLPRGLCSRKGPAANLWRRCQAGRWSKQCTNSRWWRWSNCSGWTRSRNWSSWWSTTEWLSWWKSG